MIANFFRKTKPIHAIFISILFAVYYLLAIFLVEKPDFSFLLALKKTGFLLLFLTLFFLIRFINRKNNLSGQNSYVLLILAMLFGMFPKTLEIQNVFYSHIFLLLAFRRIYSLKTNKNVKEKLFDSGLWIGVAMLFYSWSVLYLILIFTAIIVRKKQEIRNFIIPIIGFITPLFILFTYYFLNDNSNIFYDKLNLYYSYSMPSIVDFIPIVFLSLLVILAIVLVSLKVKTLINDLKPSWTLIIVHLLIALYLIFMSPQKTESFIYVFFPVTIIISNFLQLLDKMIFREIIIFCLLLLSVSVYFI